MHKKPLFLCTTACALFFCYFNLTHTSTASHLNAQTHYTLAGYNHPQRQYPQGGFNNNPRAVTNNHQTTHSFATVGENPHFKKAIQNEFNRRRDQINSYYTAAGRGGSGAHANALEELDNAYANALARQSNREVLYSIPRATNEQLEKIASGGMMGENSYFSQQLREGMDDVEKRVNSHFVGSGMYGSSAHTNALQKSLSDARARAMANQYNQDVKHMLLANAILAERNKNQLKAAEDALRQQSNAAMNVLQSAVNRDTYKQQRIDAERKQWERQDNRDWNELQKKADILHKAIVADNALQGHNKALSDTLRAEVKKALNTGTTTKMEREVESQLSSSSPKEHQPPLMTSTTEKGRAVNQFHPTHTPQHKDKENSSPITDHQNTRQPQTHKNAQSSVGIDPSENTPSSSSKTTLKTSPEASMALPSKVESANKTTANTEKSSKLMDDKATAALSHSSHVSEEKTRTPQITSSLVMSDAMFAAGFADVNAQNTLLDNIRITMFEAKDLKEKGIFLLTYGNKLKLFANPQSSQDDAHADIRYAALQAGVTLAARENQNTTTSFGLMGAYGKLAFLTTDRADAEKTSVDKWSLTAYGNIQHDSGLYANIFLSYGIFKGNITTAFIGKTKKANDTKTVNVSATVGQKLPTNFQGITLEPQAQLVYQHLLLGTHSEPSPWHSFDTLSQTDSLKMNQSNPSQWLLRIGGRLTQNKGHAVSFYGKLYVIETFEHNKTIERSESSQPTAMGTAIEGGMGMNAYLSQNIALHGAISYQHPLKKAGVSGINISAGMRYCF
ncbi:autotransporter outer membrane beta-barrel domain-containing protein [Bartonella machadoae]|uniref:autotransporter outer membrane beta-barrel domain-containing protein n=1 Tax=Bartonella machadoae TaxID=2893471 RepID=UPI001F4CDA1F|nr:autotransporter outer membrane beta-barrel domain-containing protein [Bartonella machadoae]UNE53767.1 autotransporter outer membrane beta-barrel domain-containing protein [Bartonella machadoae]